MREELTDISILYEDKNVLVINKLAGVVIQGTQKNEPSYVAKLKDFIKERDSKSGNVFLGIVHRLDKVVSGALILAKRSKAAQRLTQAFRDKKVFKIYLAEVEGVLKGEGHIRTWIGWDETKRRALLYPFPSKETKEAITYYKVLLTNREKKRSLVAVFPITGRKHQIRVLFSFLGHPIVGDVRYGSRVKVKEGEAILLHSYFLRFPHPITKEDIKIIAPLPHYFSFKKVEKIVNIDFLDKMLEKFLKEDLMAEREEHKEQPLVLCANCAWREVCVKRFSFDNIKPIKCPDYSPDVTLFKKKEERKSDKEED